MEGEVIEEAKINDKILVAYNETRNFQKLWSQTLLKVLKNRITQEYEKKGN